MSKDTTTMPSTMRHPRTVLIAAAAPCATSAAGAVTASVSVLPAERRHLVSPSSAAGTRVPTRASEERTPPSDPTLG